MYQNEVFLFFKNQLTSAYQNDLKTLKNIILSKKKFKIFGNVDCVSKHALSLLSWILRFFLCFSLLFSGVSECMHGNYTLVCILLPLSFSAFHYHHANDKRMTYNLFIKE
jgi:hypothetical protein